MQVGNYNTRRGRRFRIELKNGKVIKGLTEDEYQEIYCGIRSRVLNRRSE